MKVGDLILKTRNAYKRVKEEDTILFDVTSEWGFQYAVFFSKVIKCKYAFLVMPDFLQTNIEEIEKVADSINATLHTIPITLPVLDVTRQMTHDGIDMTKPEDVVLVSRYMRMTLMDVIAHKFDYIVSNGYQRIVLEEYETIQKFNKEKM